MLVVNRWLALGVYELLLINSASQAEPITNVTHNLQFVSQFLIRGGSAAPTSSLPVAAIPQTLRFGYYSLKHGLSSTLMLNNNGPGSTTVSISLYDPDGKRFDAEPVSLDERSPAYVSLADLANDAPRT